MRLVLFTLFLLALNLNAEAKQQVHAFYLGDSVTNLSGGLQKETVYLGAYGINFLLEPETWTGGTVYLNGLGMHGQNPTEFVGDAQTTSNIEASADTFKLYEAWIQQEFSFEKASLSLKAGLYDLNSEFYATPTALIFLNSSFGVGKELSQTGVNGPSIFPTTAPALRARVLSPEGYFIQAAVLDAVAGDPENPYGTQVRINANEGLLNVSELGYSDQKAEGQILNYGVGFWNYTKLSSNGWYFHLSGSLSQDLQAFFRYGRASTETNRFDSNLSTGLTFKSFGLAVSTVEDKESHQRESAYELTYKYSINEETYLQPDLQYIANPNANSEISHAWVGTLRFRIGI
jgi:porin